VAPDVGGNVRGNAWVDTWREYHLALLPERVDVVWYSLKTFVIRAGAGNRAVTQH
jgi:hypothetical protein